MQLKFQIGIKAIWMSFVLSEHFEETASWGIVINVCTAAENLYEICGDDESDAIYSGSLDNKDK